MKVHAHIVGAIRQDMPLFIGKSIKKQEIISNLHILFETLQKDRDIPQGDFPEVDRMKEQLQNVNFNHLPKFDNNHLTVLNNVLRFDLTELVAEINSINCLD